MESYCSDIFVAQVGILPFPALGRSEFYREFATLTNKVRHAQDWVHGTYIGPSTLHLFVLAVPRDFVTSYIRLTTARDSGWSAWYR